MPAIPSRPAPTTARVAWQLTGAVLSGLAVLVLALGTLAYRLAEFAVQQTSIGAIDDRGYDPPPADEASPGTPVVTTVQNVLLVGLDSRAGLTDEDLLRLGTEDNASRLTDTIQWLQYRPDDGRVRMVSFPRDLLVEYAGRNVKLNSLHARGGPHALVEHLEDRVGLDLDHYVEVDLAGFLKLTAAVGGVEVCLTEPLRDAYAGIDLPAGCQLLDEYEAAGYVRTRHASDAFGHGTAGRGARQQYFLRQVLGQLMTAGTLTNPARVRALVDVAVNSVVVDDGMTPRQMLHLSEALRTVRPGEMEGLGLPFEEARIDGESFNLLVEDAAEAIFDALRTGAPFPASETAGPPA